MKLMIIENDLEKCLFYESLGVERIFIDLEVMGKLERQGHLDTVITLHHSADDIARLKTRLKQSQILARVNPIHQQSEQEIATVIEKGADIVMLPFFKHPAEVAQFIRFVNGRAVTSLLLETPEALCRLDDILDIPGIDEIHIGLNDMHLGMGLYFMFELLSGGIVDYIIEKIRPTGIRYGFGGVAGIKGGQVPGGIVLKEHIRLGSEMVILSRSFFNDLTDNQPAIAAAIKDIHQALAHSVTLSPAELEENRRELKKLVKEIVATKAPSVSLTGPK